MDERPDLLDAPVKARMSAFGPTRLSAATPSRLHVLGSAVERRLRSLAPPEQPGNGLRDAVRYALLTPGKRIRPLLVLLACEELGRGDLAGLDAACALEMVHAASLVLDDLPAMDDADLRRGRPSTHVAFGEDVAILASIALLGLAFETIAHASGVDTAAKSRAISALAGAIGTNGLAAGQYADLSGSPKAQRVDQVMETNDRKTGALFVAAVDIAGAVAGVEDDRLARLQVFAAHLGQAFQLLDDLQDSAPAAGGEDGDKATLLMLLGGQEAHERLASHVRRALAPLYPGGLLATLVTGIFADAMGPHGEAGLLASSAEA